MNEPDNEKVIDDLSLVYANWFRSVSGAFDIALDLGYRAGGLPPNPAVRLVMSWEHAVVMRDVLTHLIEQYEKATGTTVPKVDSEFGPAEFPPER